MNKFIIATLVALTPYSFVADAGQKSVVEKKDPDGITASGCITPDKVDEVIENGGYEILVRGQDPLNRVLEVWFNGKRDLVVFVYEKPKDDKRENIKEVCVSGFAENIVFSGDTVDLLKKALDKVNPKT